MNEFIQQVERGCGASLPDKSDRLYITKLKTPIKYLLIQHILLLSTAGQRGEQPGTGFSVRRLSRPRCPQTDRLDGLHLSGSLTPPPCKSRGYKSSTWWNGSEMGQKSPPLLVEQPGKHKLDFLCLFILLCFCFFLHITKLHTTGKFGFWYAAKFWKTPCWKYVTHPRSVGAKKF